MNLIIREYRALRQRDAAGESCSSALNRAAFSLRFTNIKEHTDRTLVRLVDMPDSVLNPFLYVILDSHTYMSAGVNKASYRITVRQLESMIRLAEALARLYGDDEVGHLDG